MGCVESSASVGPMMNSAFVFVKPHAVSEATKELVKTTLEARGCTILKEGDISSEDIDSKKLIDQHYYAIASKATILKAETLHVPADKFLQAFGTEWATVLANKAAYNALDACKFLELDEDGLKLYWDKCKDAGKLHKLGGGFYCGCIDTVPGKPATYVFNAFFMTMRAKFTKPGECIHYYSVEFDPGTLAWADFRGKVLGSTDPAAAPPDSIRGMLFSRWEELGMASKPDTSDNGVHASASPLEGMAEKNNWLGTPLAKDPFGKLLLGASLKPALIKAWTIDPVVNYDEAGTKGSLFDALEDIDVGPAFEKLVALAKFN
ncbi:nucleoside diphosphate kinase [Pavlovales sp. CCMP2436]|nr:nucleoside diphosphate kinase [Pavlovales sp. CCMP2436]|mmetsp:Transcript_3103/g.7624  ORF Transcript_3103/g.7624 Transcript_3103/m.7624 type:complete len:320 (-) Transcript_3103:120-1079(-)